VDDGHAIGQDRGALSGGPEAEQHLGLSLDPFGRYLATALVPTEDGWREGDREMWCGIGANWSTSPLDADGQRLDDRLTPFVGATRDHSQHWSYQPGDCLALDDRLPAPCTEPHRVEVTGSFTLPDDTEVPGHEDDEGWARLVADACWERVRSHLGTEPSDPWVSGWFTIQPESWAVGARSVTGLVGKVDPTDTGAWIIHSDPARARAA
jgi:hypothetical protein